MKKNSGFCGLLTFLVFLLNAPFANAQKAKDIFNSSETNITYFGVDFSEARLIGDAGADPLNVRNSYAAINQVIVNEPKKYNLAKTFEKTNIVTDITAVLEKSEHINAATIKSANSSDDKRFTKSTVENIVKSYKFGTHKGIGLLFIMEAMNKSAEQASMYITFFDIASRKVIFTERMVGKAGGFGFRNYWAGSINKVLTEIGKSKYKEWKRNNP